MLFVVCSAGSPMGVAGNSGQRYGRYASGHSCGRATHSRGCRLGKFIEVASLFRREPHTRLTSPHFTGSQNKKESLYPLSKRTTLQEENGKHVDAGSKKPSPVPKGPLL